MRGIDLAQLWRSRRWRLLLNLIDRLPRESHYVEAMLDDEQYALLVADMPLSEPERRMREWTPELEALATVADRLVDVIDVLSIANGGKASELRRSIRPVTAIERVRNRQRQRKHEALVARVLNRENPPTA